MDRVIEKTISEKECQRKTIVMFYAGASTAFAVAGISIIVMAAKEEKHIGKMLLGGALIVVIGAFIDLKLINHA